MQNSNTTDVTSTQQRLTRHTAHYTWSKRPFNTQNFKVLSTISSAMPQYSYSQSSLGSDNIRLLRVLPCADDTAPIQCKLCDYHLQKSTMGTHQYEALSYVWGGSDKHKFVFIDGYHLPVTANLHNALSRLRDHSFERIIWADSVCINQMDKQEKEYQIQLMAKIYGLANRVVVYLGEAADDSDQALEDIRVSAGDESTKSSISEKSQEAVLKLVKRQWFRRIWVSWQTADDIHRNY
jgi:hypothetical protein